MHKEISKKYIDIEPSQGSAKHSIRLKSDVISYDSDGTTSVGLRYGIGFSDLEKANNAGFFDSIPDNYNERFFTKSVFPKLDTIDLGIDN